MKKIISKILLTCFFILSINLNFTAYADEVVTEIGCNLSFQVTDESNSFPGKIKVIMTNEKGDKEEFTLTKGNCWGGDKIPKYTIPQGKYSITFEGIDDGYNIVNKDDSQIENFDATKNGYDFKWKIISNVIATEERDNTGTNTEENSAPTNTEEITNNIQNENSEIINTKTNKEDADKVFNEFVESVKFIETDSKWERFLNLYDRYADTPSVSYSQDYADFVNGGTKEKFLEMSLFDRFIYEETYIRLAKYLSFGDWNLYFSTKEAFYQNVTSSVATKLNAYDRSNTIASDAYLKLMEWQYDYIKEHNAPYDFVTGLDYLQAKGEKINPEEESKKKEIQEEKDMEALRGEVNDKKGIWDDVFNSLAKNAISFIVIIVLCIVIGVIIYIRKKRNMDDDGVR